MKKIAICFSFILAFLLCACGAKSDGKAGQKSLYAQGLDMISLMGEMVQSDTYFAAYSSVPTLREPVKEISQAVSGGQYDKPAAVYRLSLQEDGLAAILQRSGTDLSDADLSDDLKAYMHSKMLGACANFFNSPAGTEALAASAVYTCSKSFVCMEASENVLYLYTYENTNPVLISFLVGEDHAVYASGTYILNETIDMTDLASINAVLGLDVPIFQIELLETN